MMTEDQKKLILDLALEKISEAEFLNHYPINLTDDLTHIQSLLIDANNRKDATQLEYALILFFRFGCASENADILCQLIQEDWHMQHENIALLLKKLKSPDSVDCLYQTTLTKFKYLDFDESHALAVKAIWALGAIGTEEAKGKLKLLSESENSILSENAKHQLTRNSS